MEEAPSSEKVMVEGAIRYLRKVPTRFATEVPFMSRSIDLVYEDSSGNLVTVEFKRNDWRRALRQAQDHSLGAERVYICLPESRITAAARREAASLGIGIFAWTESDPFNEEVSSDQDEEPWTVSREWLRERFRFRLPASEG